MLWKRISFKFEHCETKTTLFEVLRGAEENF